MTLYLIGFTGSAGAAESQATGEAWVNGPSQPTPTTTITSSTGSVSATSGVTSTPPTPPSPASQGTTVAPNHDAAADADPEALTMFRADLDPYGRWVDDARYGRVWIPSREIVGANFSPYVTSGHWALDADDNWVWVSDYPFGKVVFHYGRWFYSADYGWAWVPGRTYAPSWVVWRTPTTSSYAYVGWAPMPPRFGWFSSGVVWYSSMWPTSYVFCPSDYLFYPSVGLYVVRDPWLVGRLGIYTSFYYPPFGYYGWGYHGHGYGGMGYHHTHHYGPPVYRTGVSTRAVPRERVAAQPRFAGATRGDQRANFGRGERVGATPSVGSRAAASPRSASSWTAPRVSPLERRDSGMTTRSASRPFGDPSASRGASFRSSSPAARAPSFRSSPAFRSSTPTFRSSSPSFRSAPSFRSSPSFRSAPSFRSSPSFRSAPSFRSSPSFRGGGRHR